MPDGKHAGAHGFLAGGIHHAVYTFVDAGADVTVASIRGGRAPIDPRSLQEEGGQHPASVARYMNDPGLRAQLEAPSRSRPSRQGQYDIVFLPGGHGTMWDLPASGTLAQLVATTLERGDVVGAVCHGPAGLVAARFNDGKPVVEGKRVAGFTNAEERAVVSTGWCRSCSRRACVNSG